MRRDRQPRRVNAEGQRAFGFVGGTATHMTARAAGEDHFVADDPRELFVGEQRLEAYLSANGLRWVVRLRRLLEELDYTALVPAYDWRGRKALHPRVVLGLIVYGMLQRQWSLRELEGLARRDVGAWWMCGGHHPDHSTIGKFVQLHAAVLTEEFFVETVRTLVRQLRMTVGVIAGDGTVIEAASRFELLKAEALRAAEATQPSAAGQAALERLADRAAHGRGGDRVPVVRSEPQAVVQPCKDGRVRAAYKPSIWRHAGGLIVGQGVEASSEPAAVPRLLTQHAGVFAAGPARVLLDANYCTPGVLELLVSASIDVLCPAGSAEAGQWQKTSYGGYYPKSAFTYEAAHDRYRCPAGQVLEVERTGTEPRGGTYRLYRGTACVACGRRAQCTRAARGRTIKRYAGDEIKELMATTMAHPAARRAYRQRREVVEPAFAELRERQGLRRFHRRGLTGVGVEFALHCIAFDLKVAVRHSPLSTLWVCAVFGHRAPEAWQLLAVVVITC